MFERAADRELGLLRTLLIGAFIILVPLALITTTIRVAISEQAVYDYSVRNHGAERVSGIPESELIAANQEIRDYLVTDNPGPLAPRVTNAVGEEEPLFNAEETIHMTDVRNLVQLMLTVQVLAVAALLTIVVLLLVLWPVRVLAAAMLYGSTLTIGLLAMIGFLAMTGFDAAWSDSNDFWRLDPDTDHLIQMYPEAFWQEATLAIGGLIALQAAAMATAASLYLMLTRDRSGAIEARPRDKMDVRGAPRRPRLAPPNPRNYVQ
jgi:integral membrane protein (TIGR01906 family)